MEFLKSLFGQKTEAGKMTAKVNERLISDAYVRRAKEIDSLRQYDRGEKEIHAPNLKTAVRNLR